MSDLRAILFDTFGTVGDWRSSLIAELTKFGAGRGIAADWVARLIVKYRWLGYVGLAVVAYVAIDMVVRGAREVAHAL